MVKKLLSAVLVVFLALCFLNISCPKRTPHPDQVKGISQLSFDRSAGILTIKAKETSLHLILQKLSEIHQIDVRVPTLETDQLVTVNIIDLPLQDALMKLLPKNSQFRFTTGELELKIAGKTGDKKIKTDRKPKSRDLPTKGKTVPLPDDRKTNIKLPPERVRLGMATTGEQGTKSPPSVRELPPARGHKRPKKIVPLDTLYLRLNINIQYDSMQVVNFLEVEGNLVQSNIIRGDFIFASFVDDSVVSVGSMQNPLSTRSYHQDIGHSVGKADEAFFVISLPSVFLAEETLRRTVIKFYLLDKAVDMPQVLDTDSFPKFEQFLNLVGEISQAELLRAYFRRQQ